jgi:hypothetical protein
MKLNGTEEAIEGVREAISALRRTQTHSSADERARSVEVMRLTGVIESAAKAIVSRDAATRVKAPPVPANTNYVKVTEFNTAIEGVAKTIMPYFEDLFAQVDTLKAELAEVKKARAPSEWRGIWDPLQSYQRGDRVTADGALWHAEADSTGARPGSGFPWKLCEKTPRGRDRK